jgi:hypothetical protein
MLNWARNVSQNKSTNLYELCYAIDGAVVELDIVDYTVKNKNILEGLSCENKNVDAVWLIGYGAAHRVRRGSYSSASAFCKAGPSTNLGPAPQRRPSTEREP